MLILLFMLVWIVFNGQITVEILLFGLGIGLLMYAFVCCFMGYRPSTDITLLKLFFPAVAYVFVLLWEILKANISTVRLIMSSKYDNDPVLVEFDVPIKTSAGQLALANSITLTPGTITVKNEGSHYVVHCLDREMAEGLDDSVFVRRILKMEEKVGKKA